MSRPCRQPVCCLPSEHMLDCRKAPPPRAARCNRLSPSPAYLVALTGSWGPRLPGPPLPQDGFISCHHASHACYGSPHQVCLHGRPLPTPQQLESPQITALGPCACLPVRPLWPIPRGCAWWPCIAAVQQATSPLAFSAAAQLTLCSTNQSTARREGHRCTARTGAGTRASTASHAHPPSHAAATPTFLQPCRWKARRLFLGRAPLLEAHTGLASTPEVLVCMQGSAARRAGDRRHARDRAPHPVRRHPDAARRDRAAAARA